MYGDSGEFNSLVQARAPQPPRKGSTVAPCTSFTQRSQTPERPLEDQSQHVPHQELLLQPRQVSERVPAERAQSRRGAAAGPRAGARRRAAHEKPWRWRWPCRRRALEWGWPREVFAEIGLSASSPRPVLPPRRPLPKGMTPEHDLRPDTFPSLTL